MPRFTLVVFDRYDVAKSTIHYHKTYETNLGLAFKEALVKIWGGELVKIWQFKEEIKGYGDKLGIDFEEESYLFFEG
jgi:hypothetical protein